MNSLLKSLLLGGSTTALVAGVALAQDAATVDIETVTSSVSRIDLKGFEAPTPVTVVGIEQINRDAKVQLGDQLRELPQIRGGGSISTGNMGGNLVQINAGTDTVAIRGLGAQRNLVLFDRQRVVGSTPQDGVVDLALIPSGLTQRVDVVTGGASAAWGSDAVTGVINVVINKTFEGFKGSATYSNSTEVENSSYRLSLAWGTSFLEGKGHAVIGADFTRQDQSVFDGQRDRAHTPDGRTFVYNSAYCNAITYPTATPTSNGTCSSPSGAPLLVYAYAVGSTTNVQGGLTQSNTAGNFGSGLAANGLKGTMFVGEESTPTQFNYGTIYNTSSCYNGCTNDQFGNGGWGAINPYHSTTLFNYTSYQVLPDVKASVQLNFSRLTLRGAGATVNGANRVTYADNPYMPDSVARRFVCNPTGISAVGPGIATCAATLSNGYNPYTYQNEASAWNNVDPDGAGPLPAVPTLQALSVAQRQARPSQTMTVGYDFSANRPNPGPSSGDSRDSIDYNWMNRCNALLQNCGYYYKQLMRGVFTLDGTIGDSWTWTAFISHAQNRIDERIANTLNIRVNNAFDAVRVNSGNVGTSGLPIGSIQCRGLLNPSLSATFATAEQEAKAARFGVTRTSELAGCTPFNPFGDNPASNAAMNYVRPASNPVKTDYERVTAINTMENAAFSMSGVLPWTLPAGEIGVAFGAEWRFERDGQYNVDKYAQIGLYSSGNFGDPYEGKLHSEEGFVEIAIPILKDTWVQNLSLDLAGRMTNYSFSGLVETWKIGVQSQIIDDLRFRATWSTDIRAPNVYDLFVPGTQSGNTCAPFVPGPTGSNGGQPNQCFSITGGNPNLQPEKANTIAAGFVWTPAWIEGLTASLDWYQIHVHGALYTPGQTEPLTRCQQGELVYCSLLVFENGQPYPGGTTSAVTFVYRTPVNAAQLNTGGFDFAVAYGFDLFTGSATVGFNGNYVYDFSRVLQGIEYNGIGQTGGYYTGGARFQGTVNFDYREGAWSFGLQERIIGDSVLDRGNKGDTRIAEQTVTYAVVNGATVATVSAGNRNFQYGASKRYTPYSVSTDVRVQYRWSNNITLFGAVDNLQDLPMFGGNLRRTYRGGIRFNY